MKAIIAPARTTAGYPNNGFLEKAGRISETIPMAGNIKIYTSGCPKTQNRCCHNTGLAPAATTKKLNPNTLSKLNSNKATVITGNAKTNNIAVINDIQVKIGIFIKDIPGALKFTIVTMKLKAAASDATPKT